MTAPRLAKRRAQKSGKFLILKHQGGWWRITPTGLAQPCTTWRIATHTVPWTRKETP